MKRPKILDRYTDEIVKAYRDANLSMDVIAGVYQTSKSSVRNLLIREGVYIQRPGRRTKEKNNGPDRQVMQPDPVRSSN